LQSDLNKFFLVAFLIVVSLSILLSLAIGEGFELTLMLSGALAAYLNISFWSLVGKLVFREGGSSRTFWLVLLVKLSLFVPAFYLLANGDKSFIAPVCLSFVAVYMVGAGLLLLKKPY